MEAPATPTGLLSLPNEILLDIIIPLRAPQLLPLTLICRRFHDLVIRILQNRLTLAASIAERSIVIECYAPSRKLNEPHMLGDYLGTDGLEPISEDTEERDYAPGEKLQKFNGLYSRFQPYRRVLEKRVVWKHPAGDIPGSRTYRPVDVPSNIPTMIVGSSFASPLFDDAESDAPSQGVAATQPEPSNNQELPVFETVKTLVHLDAGDLFAQLCANVDISIPGPKSGLFNGFQKVGKDGVLRVFRNWLAAQAKMKSPTASASTLAEEVLTGSSMVRGPPKTAEILHGDSSILWVDNKHSIGVRFSVHERKWNRAPQPILLFAEEELPVSYELRYEELLVRTRDLLLASEELNDQQFRENGKAIVIGTWI